MSAPKNTTTEHELAKPWRPQPAIVAKALGLHWRQGRLLASPVSNDSGTLRGLRPLGGTLEFGEPWQTALRREFHEELGVQLSHIGEPVVMENIYVHEGQTGHEIVFIAEVEFAEGAFDNCEQIVFSEDNGSRHTARWYDPSEQHAKGIDFFPLGLIDAIGQKRPPA